MGVYKGRKSEREQFESPFERCKIPSDPRTFNSFVGRAIPNKDCSESDPCEIPPKGKGPKGKGKRNEPCRGGSGTAAESGGSGAGDSAAWGISDPNQNCNWTDPGEIPSTGKGPKGKGKGQELGSCVSAAAEGIGSEKPGWSGTGDRAAFHRRILPEVLEELCHYTGVWTMRYGGSYSRHTSHCYADIDICVMTDHPITSAKRRHILNRLQSKRDESKQRRQFFGNAEFCLEQFAIKVSIPKKKGTRTLGLDEYTLVFQNWQGLCDEALMYPTLRRSLDRSEADRSLLAFYHANTGAQNVARLIKYATYAEENKFPGTIIECITEQVAHRQFGEEGVDSQLPAAAGIHAKVLAHFDRATALAFGAEYIHLQIGEIVELLDPPHGQHADSDWSYGKVGMRLGWFPTKFVKKMAPTSPASDTGVSFDGIKTWCVEKQDQLYRSVVHEISLGMDSTILKTMVDDDVAHKAEPPKELTAKMIDAMSTFYDDEENREFVLIKRSPARTWTQWGFLGDAPECAPSHLAHEYSTGIPMNAESGSAASSSTQSNKGKGKGCKGKFTVAVSTETELMVVPMSASGFADFVDTGIPNM